MVDIGLDGSRSADSNRRNIWHSLGSCMTGVVVGVGCAVGFFTPEVFSYIRTTLLQAGQEAFGAEHAFPAEILLSIAVA